MQEILKPGDKAIDFNLPNEDNVDISLNDLINHTIVLYFYPKDNTSGCTAQAQEFTELIEEFKKLNCVIVGVSPDNGAKHRKFIESKNLKITLLSDEDKAVAAKYGAYGKKKMYGKEVFGIIRSIFIIKNGEILKASYNIKAKGSAQKTLDFIKQLEEQSARSSY